MYRLVGRDYHVICSHCLARCFLTAKEFAKGRSWSLQGKTGLTSPTNTSSAANQRLLYPSLASMVLDIGSGYEVYSDRDCVQGKKKSQEGGSGALSLTSTFSPGLH